MQIPVWIKKLTWRPIFRTYKKFKNWRELTFVIPPYHEKREIILAYQKKYKCISFIETGTFLGDTIERLKYEFKQLYSIELSEELASNAQRRFENEAHIRIYQGDSGELIEKIFEQAQTPVLFWLDGHYSGTCIGDNQIIKTAKGSLITPILKELDAILSNGGIQNNVILIDDARLFTGKSDYPKFQFLRAYLLKFGIKPNQVTKKRDIIRIVPE
jgi:hypothetical protein